MKTTGNTVFISGGSAGIGFAIAKRLYAEGNNIIINGRNEERLQNALKELEGAVAIKGDLSVEADRFRIAEELKTNHPEINIIINNAGAAFAYLLNETENAHEKAAAEMNTNYFSVIHFTELLLPFFKPEKRSCSHQYFINCSFFKSSNVTNLWRIKSSVTQLYTSFKTNV